MAVPLVPKTTRAAAAPVAAPPAVAPKREVTRREMIGVVALVVLTIIGFQGYLWVTSGSSVAPTNLPIITAAQLEKAKALWEEKGPKDYNLELKFVAPFTDADLTLEVRDGVGKVLKRSGVESTRADELAQWTIEGQFAQISKYLAMDTSAEAKQKGWTMVNVGEFDRNYGYPLEYSRQGNGHQTKYHITIKKFATATP